MTSSAPVNFVIIVPESSIRLTDSALLCAPLLLSYGILHPYSHSRFGSDSFTVFKRASNVDIACSLKYSKTVVLRLIKTVFTCSKIFSFSISSTLFPCLYLQWPSVRTNCRQCAKNSAYARLEVLRPHRELTRDQIMFSTR